MNSLNPLTLSLQGSHLIEASAGTGKTYTIAALYVRLILEKKLTPKDILVVTFTDAATEELRDRIRTRLSESAQYFREKIQSEDKFLIDLRNSYDKTKWNWCAKNLEVAANYMDEAAVFTIHSWCNRMLQQHAFDSGSPFKQDVNTDDAELLNNVIRDYWRVHFYGLDKNQCEFIVKNLAKSPDDFSGQIQGLLKETEALKLNAFSMTFDDVIKAWTNWENTNARLEQSAKDSWKNDRSRILDFFKNAKDLPKKGKETYWYDQRTCYKNSEIEDRLSKIDQWADGNQEIVKLNDIERFGVIKLKEGIKEEYKSDLDKALLSTFQDISAFQAIDDLVANSNQRGDIVKNIKQHAIKWIRNRYAEEKKKLSRVTFEDMLSNLDNSLQGQNQSRLGEVIRTQYPVALIDEFQDTDPIQYRIFEAIYQTQTQSSSSCFFIGDPKQAIYSFRGADIYTYLKAHKKTQNHHTLDTNFRSTDALVKATNQLFEQAENEQGAFNFKDTQNNNLLPFTRVEAKGRKNDLYIDDQLAPALTFWKWETEKTIAIGDYREHMAKVTASEIVKLLNDEKVGFKGEEFKKIDLEDIAILVKDGKEAKIIRRELNNRNLKSVYLSEKDSIYDTDEAPDVLIWLNAMANPRNEGKVRAAVSTGTLGFSKEELYSLTLEDVQWEIHLERFQKYQSRWQKSGILPALRLLIHDYGLHLSLNDDNESERKLTNILHLAEVLQQHSSKIEGEETLIHHFTQLLESEEYRSGNNSIIRLESDANLIKIVTIYKSKGLEYPLVFLPFVSDARVIDGKSNYYKYHDDSGVHIDLDKNPANQVLNEKERLQEDLRLIYVAVTRAKYACWLGIASTTRLPLSAIGHLIGGKISNLDAVKGKCSSIEIATLPEPTDTSFIDKTKNDLTGKARESEVNTWENWWTASYSVLKFDYKNLRGEIPEMETAEDNNDDDDDDDTEFSVESSVNPGVYKLPKGKKPGDQFHKLLEKCGDSGFAQAHKDEKWRKDTIDELFPDNNFWNKENREVLCKVLPTWLEISLTKNVPLIENVSLSNLDKSKSQYRSELEFLIGANSVDVKKLDELVAEATLNNEPRPGLQENKLNGFLKGFIDLIFCHNDKYYIVDYKSNYLGNSEEDYSELKIREDMLKHRYDLQYSLYLLALHRLLSVRLGDSYNYDKHIGGAIYVFLRGNATIFDKPSGDFIKQLDNLFGAKNNG